MERKLRIFSLVLLILLGSSAIGGGWMLISDPSGFSMELPIELLNQTPFDNYLIPGIILLVALGFLSIIVCIFTIRQTTNYTYFLILQGCILFSWLTTELIMNDEFYHALYHLPLYTTSLLLIAIGIRLRYSGLVT
jgi:purine-cytosine permease-like protein